MFRFRYVGILVMPFVAGIPAWGQLLSIALPERTRLLEDQRVDLVIEARNLTAGVLKVTANGADLSSLFTGPTLVDLDCDTVRDAVWRANLVSFKTPGWVRLEAVLTTPQGTFRDVRDIWVQPFPRPSSFKNLILYIGDGMTEAWRDAGRIVSRSVETVPGVPGLREGFYDRLLEMDRMPVSGAIMHHSLDKLIPDSAPTATALATGNKTFDGGLSVFPDGTDCGFGSASDAATIGYALDNPRIETIAEYLKRRFGYRVGLVTTASVADATPAAFASHSGDRDTAFEIVRQYLENPLLNGQPGPDVLMGGGGESFDPNIRPDKRDILAEFAAKGYKIVKTATELRSVRAGDERVVGIFKTAQTTIHSSGVRAASTAHMNVAYDKLRLLRPGSEPLPSFGGWEDQPFLDLMTQKAIEVLAGPGGNQPFFLMVEAASIDKQSHSNHFAGAAWDVIEFDKAVGVGRAWASTWRPKDTLMVVTADHGQPMVIIGVADIPDADYFDRTSNLRISISSPIGTHSATVYKDVNANVRALIPYGSAGGGRTGPPAENYVDAYGTFGFPDYIDADGDGYPENRETGGKGRRRLAVGFRTGNHTYETLPLSAEGPGALLFTGYFDQTEVPLKMAAAVAHDTSDLDAALDKLIYTAAFPRTPGK